MKKQHDCIARNFGARKLMNGIRFGKFFGIALELHITFIMLIAGLLILMAILEPQNLIPYALMLFFLFTSVFIHELFHSVTSVLLGIKVEKIILLPIGGISVAKKMPEQAYKEFLIAIAGPFFNFLMIAIIAGIVYFNPELFPSIEMISNPDTFNNTILQFPLFSLFWVNLILGVFNLFVPALPLDGGRVLRSILAMKFGFNKATHLASKISTIISVVLGFIGLLGGNFLLIIVAGFVYL
ncbi:MAG: site-2 protease family protein, partial [Candidatus Diapherotrites archaeon]|nr:site-2 protease family protein [Candidatus Diapherotrites archaeon]